jgi:hypothetical protein
MCLQVLTWEQVRKEAENRLKRAAKDLAAAQVELLDAISNVEMLKGNVKEKDKVPAIIFHESKEQV